jgi:hypothetical protein
MRFFILAAALFAYIYIFEIRQPKTNTRSAQLVFGGVQAGAIGVVEIHLSNQVIRAERTNELWRLTTPLYPAQATPIESFLETLTSLEKKYVISPTEVSAQPGKLKDYGLEPPLLSVSITVGSNRHHLYLGARTPLSDGIYAQMAGSGEALVTDGTILQAIPTNADQWRSPFLANLAGKQFDHIQIRAAQRLIEFERDVTNQLWRISKPTPGRANNERVRQIIQRLNTARVNQFVTDSPAADLERYGLQTPALELSLFLDTNRVTGFEFGASPTNDPASIYARLLSTTNVVTTAREILEVLNLPPVEYRDRQLLSIPREQFSVIQVNGTNGFTLMRTNNQWAITAPAPIPTDQDLTQGFIKLLTDMDIADFVKDVPTDADLKQFGLTPAQFSIGIYGASTNGASVTNTLLTQLDFGEQKRADAMVYARRSDETPVYLTADILPFLPKQSWELRDRRIFNFAPTNVVAITFSFQGKPYRFPHKAAGWVDDPLLNAKVEEFIFRLGRVFARKWSGKGPQKMRDFGMSDDRMFIEVEVTPDIAKAPLKLWFGRPAVRGNIYAATILPGDTEGTSFEFPGDLYLLMAEGFSLKQ